MELTGSQIVIECLKEQGVDTVFGYPGGTILNIYDELYRHPEIHHILTSHEQGASHAADGYARATGKVGVCLATSGPGATNLVTGIATAYMDSVPMVAITANVGRPLLGRDSFQEVDIAGIVMPVTKHSYIVKDVTQLADTIRKADRLILPGVGAFGDAMDKLVATGLVPVIRAEAEKKPLLGICLGMQLLFEKSYEYGEHAGLGFIQGEVCPLEPDLTDKSLKVPQIGWNALHIVKDDPLFQYIREGEYVYYVHSYYGKHCAESTLAVSEYSIPVTGAVRAGKVYGTQFHPEKSGDTGLRILKAFAEL